VSRPRRAPLATLAILLALLGAGCSSESPGPADAATPAPGAATAEWTAYGGDALGARFSPLAEITRDNVTSLAVAWTFRTGETPQAAPTRRPTAFEATPILVDGTLYLSTPLGKVFALDPATGTERWRFDAQVNPQTPFGDFTSRGVSAWLDPGAAEGAPCRRRIFLAAMDARLIALDARTGRTCADFGEQGTVNLRTGLRNPPQSDGEYGMTSPPAVVNGVVVIGSSVSDNGRTDLASGEIRAFDARTGALRWSWDPIPRAATDPAWTTWNGPVAHATGAANAWAPIAADVERDLVVIPTSSPSPDYYGGERLGANLYANSIVALRASTGARVWHFQVVHHDLWDYDVQAQPSLVMVRRDGREIPAVVQATKTGQLFVLHRETGVPIFPVQERPVPARAVAGETVSPTQPFSTLPSFGLQHVTPDDTWGLTPLDRRRCRDAIDGAHYDGVFTPPGLDVTLVTPSNIGGAHWGGVAFDPGRQIVVVPVNRLAALVQLIPRERHDPGRNEGGWEYAPMRGTPYVMRRRILLSPLGLPCTSPPFGTLVAVSLLTGKIIWEVPLGTTRDLVAARIFLPITVGSGTPNLGGPIVTAGSLVFIGAAMDNYLRAFDIESGRELWKGRLPAGGQATPMTYRLPNGRQYVVIAAGGHGKMGTTRGDSVVAFALR
jgi:quinoprotein glucose dehydrogenase